MGKEENIIWGSAAKKRIKPGHVLPQAAGIPDYERDDFLITAAGRKNKLKE